VILTHKWGVLIPYGPFGVAIAPASGIIAEQLSDMPQEGPCAGLRRRAAQLR